MLQAPPVAMSGSRTGRNGRSRTGTPDRGGIRKRGGGPRVDRDGDLDMGATAAPSGGRGGGRGAGRGRGGPGTSAQRDGRRPGGGDKDKVMDALQKATFGNSSAQANIRQPRASTSGGGLMIDGNSTEKGGLAQLKIRGWKASKAATNPDGGIESLLGFLEKKATSDPRAAAHQRLKIHKSRVEGDALIISVRPEQVDWVLRVNGYSFAGAPLSIEKYGRQPASKNAPSSAGPSQATADTKAKMSAFLSKRYYEQTKLLDLSNLGSDQDLVDMGMFNSTSTESKFFPALMKVCELSFDTPSKRKEAVESISLAHNQLASVTPVTTVAQTFPDLKNLDLSNNQLKDISALSSWRWKFRGLDFLDLSGNPVSTEGNFKEAMLKWYPKLRTLNNMPVRTAEEIAAKRKTPIPILPPSFNDESSIAENFLKAFFVGFDHDRNDTLNGIYDNDSIFSFNVNTAAPHAPQSTEARPGWDRYIKRSRNLQKINNLPARMSRTYVGRENIRDAWKSFPKTQHPDLLANPNEWLIECHPIPGLPDPSGQSPAGVGGLLIMVHGKFDEFDPNSGNKLETRSFDRTFVLGPGSGMGGLRVSNDMLCLRTFGDCQAWMPEGGGPSAVQTPAPPSNAHSPAPPAAPQQSTHPQAQNGYGMPAPGKTEEQVKKEQLVLETSFRTKMTLEFSEMALSGNGWNLDAALKNFEDLKARGTLPPNAFLSTA